ncbi:MAG: serine kinase [Lentisphaerae bacterium]|nr:serine kinase [Lentisphaerota bacterium]
MTLRDLIEALGPDLKAGAGALDRPVTGGYAGDLLSDVLAHARPGNLWVTIQIHANAIAVAGMKDLAGILVVNGRQPEAETLRKAEAEGVPVMVTALTAFEAVGRLRELGIGGKQA